ncbi:MAG: family metallopeptidase [Herminiimonas sp.]|nr:family metallopeptidase [Herminiimonas sp.]
MQIIVLRTRLAGARPLTLTGVHLVALAFLFLVATISTAVLLNFLFLRPDAPLRLPFVTGPTLAAAPEAESRKDKYVRENIAAMAKRLGEMQAQLMQLDALGERVQGLAGVKPETFNFRQVPGRGGAEPSSAAHASRDISMSEFQSALDAMGRDLTQRSDYMDVVESALMRDKIQFKMLPTSLPVNVSYNASGFGWRVDPFTGRSTFHEGIDFPGPVGTPIASAAGGVVIAAEYHHEFGNMLEIDHGNGIVTRYAHASRLLVRVGDIVRRGQHVANIGSTGRSTGSHLHFEVVVKGVHQNPNKFLAAGDTVKLSASK